jgi:16S rRNA (guanine966-N2)-methyltransferase
MRVIGGVHKRRKLHPFKTQRIRPTSDRLRETIFNILGAGVRDASVLDLYAGSGALAIEALSRGASAAVMVDRSREACKIMRLNVQACGLDDKARIIRWNIMRNLDCLHHHRPAFNLIFIDAPYHKGMIGVTLTHLQKCAAAAPGASVVVEHGRREPLPPKSAGFALTDSRAVGKSLVSFLTYVV